MRKRQLHPGRSQTESVDVVAPRFAPSPFGPKLVLYMGPEVHPRAPAARDIEQTSLGIVRVKEASGFEQMNGLQEFRRLNWIRSFANVEPYPGHPVVGLHKGLGNLAS